MNWVGVGCRDGLGSGPERICFSPSGGSFCLLLLEQTSAASSLLTSHWGGWKVGRGWGNSCSDALGREPSPSVVSRVHWCSGWVRLLL